MGGMVAVELRITCLSGMLALGETRGAVASLVIIDEEDQSEIAIVNILVGPGKLLSLSASGPPDGIACR